MRRGRLIGAALAAAALGAAPFACSNPPALLGAGGQCFQTTDCQQGLACVQQKSGPSMCSTDFSSIVSTEEAGSADAPVMPREAGEGAPPSEGGGSEATAPSPESAPPDVGTQPPPDTGSPPQDAQPPPMEAAPREAAVPPDAAPDTSAAGGDSGAGDAPGG